MSLQVRTVKRVVVALTITVVGIVTLITDIQVVVSVVGGGGVVDNITDIAVVIIGTVVLDIVVVVVDISSSCLGETVGVAFLHLHGGRLARHGSHGSRGN